MQALVTYFNIFVRFSDLTGTRRFNSFSIYAFGVSVLEQSTFSGCSKFIKRYKYVDIHNMGMYIKFQVYMMIDEVWDVQFLITQILKS